MIEGWQLAIMLKPIGLLILFAPGAMLVWWLRRFAPESSLKRFLLISWKV